jgi:hypothetical protein
MQIYEKAHPLVLQLGCIIPVLMHEFMIHLHLLGMPQVLTSHESCPYCSHEETGFAPVQLQQSAPSNQHPPRTGASMLHFKALHGGAH